MELIRINSELHPTSYLDSTTDLIRSNLLTHVYQYFGTFYGCSHQGGPDFPAYQGRASMYEVHKYVQPLTSAHASPRIAVSR